jgi:Pyruvate/2-oxoacid:ferredoxin oxidoreductase delta subunit
MCIYCDMWGDGMVWYLNPKNYPRHMYTLPKEEKKGGVSKPKGEANPAGYINMEKAIVDAMEQGPEEYKKVVQFARDAVDATQGTVGGWMGQAVPLRDMEKMVEMCNPLGVIACICRKAMLGIEERDPKDMTCMGMGVGMLKWERFPERYKGGVKYLTVEEAKQWLRELDKRGFVHSLMMFGPRFIGGICNCDYPACDALTMRLDHGFNMLKGHHVAMVDYDLCNGCNICVQRCQFGALKMNVTLDKANIDQMRCFGCGLCETACPRVAISLFEKAKIPALKEVW